MARDKILVANWKMNHSQVSAAQYFKEFFQELQGKHLNADVKAHFAVPFTLLPYVKELLAGTLYRPFAQNIHWQEKGAYTGEISLGMLHELGISGTLIAHSERRQYFGETDATAAAKTKAALRHGFTPILCVGENLEQRNAGETNGIIRQQLTAVLSELTTAGSLMIAYEPVWAIGTGLAATPEQAQEVHHYIRTLLTGFFGSETAERIPILYGGSVTLQNITSLIQQQDIDGGLVGGASLVGHTFAHMLLALSNSSN